MEDRREDRRDPRKVGHAERSPRFINRRGDDFGNLVEARFGKIFDVAAHGVTDSVIQPLADR